MLTVGGDNDSPCTPSNATENTFTTEASFKSQLQDHFKSVRGSLTDRAFRSLAVNELKWLAEQPASWTGGKERFLEWFTSAIKSISRFEYLWECGSEPAFICFGFSRDMADDVLMRVSLYVFLLATATTRVPSRVDCMPSILIVFDRHARVRFFYGFRLLVAAS